MFNHNNLSCHFFPPFCKFENNSRKNSREKNDFIVFSLFCIWIFRWLRRFLCIYFFISLLQARSLRHRCPFPDPFRKRPRAGNNKRTENVPRKKWNGILLWPESVHMQSRASLSFPWKNSQVETKRNTVRGKCFFFRRCGRGKKKIGRVEKNAHTVSQECWHHEVISSEDWSSSSKRQTAGFSSWSELLSEFLTITSFFGSSPSLAGAVASGSPALPDMAKHSR